MVVPEKKSVQIVPLLKNTLVLSSDMFKMIAEKEKWFDHQQVWLVLIVL